MQPSTRRHRQLLESIRLQRVATRREHKVAGGLLELPRHLQANSAARPAATTGKRNEEGGKSIGDDDVPSDEPDGVCVGGHAFNRRVGWMTSLRGL